MEKDCIFKIYRVKFYSKKLDKGDPNVTIEHSTAQHSTAQHSTAQHSTAQHSTAQHSTAQHSTAQHSTLNKRVYLACTKTDLLTQIKSFSFIDEKDFSIVINRKVVA